MKSNTPTRQRHPKRRDCCTLDGAWTWVEGITESALDGDTDMARLLGFAIEHALEIERVERAR